MKEYRVEKITKYEALDEINKEIRIYAISVSLGILGMALFLGISSISIIPFFASFPLVVVQGRALDLLDDSIKLKKRILNLHDEECVTHIISNSFHSFTDEEINKIASLYESNKKTIDEVDLEKEEIRSVRKK